MKDATHFIEVQRCLIIGEGQTCIMSINSLKKELNISKEIGLETIAVFFIKPKQNDTKRI